jgi:glutamate/tyrosine decarboxylase-like PLP-dependent enzyme
VDARLDEDAERFAAILDRARALAGDYLDSLDHRPAAATLPDRGLAVTATLPVEGVGALAALDRFSSDYDRYLSASPGARYFGFVTGGGSPAALAADWLVATFDQNAQLNGDSCAPFIEAQAIDMLRQLLAWPATWTGVCVTGATMANYVGIAMARQWAGKMLGRDIAADGLWGLQPIAVFAGAAHSSTSKALSMAGFGRNALHSLPLLDGRETFDIAALEAALIAHGDAPKIVVASAGTVNTVDFDDLAALAALKQRHPFWLHVDAAFGGIAAASPARRALLAGIEAADSVTVDAHKWLNVPYDCAVAFTAQKHLPLQIEIFRNQSAYLPAPEAVAHNYLHLTPENSRRLRALPLWMSLVAYGQAGFAEIVERNCASAQLLGERIAAHPRFRLAAPVRLNVVCLALREDRIDAAQQLSQLCKALHAEGTAFVTPSMLDGKPVLRVAICNWRTTDADIEMTCEALFRLADALAMPGGASEPVASEISGETPDTISAQH